MTHFPCKDLGSMPVCRPAFLSCLDPQTKPRFGLSPGFQFLLACISFGRGDTHVLLLHPDKSTWRYGWVLHLHLRVWLQTLHLQIRPLSMRFIKVVKQILLICPRFQDSIEFIKILPSSWLPQLEALFSLISSSSLLLCLTCAFCPTMQA